MSTDETQRKKLGHRLEELWRRFRESVSDSQLERFDPTISELDKYEDIRYPEKIAEEGMSDLIDFTNTGASKPSNLVAGKAVPSYRLVVDELDALIRVIFDKASVSPIALISGFKKDARDFLSRDNKSPLLNFDQHLQSK